MKEDKTIECLLELNNEKFVVDEQLGLWVKFEAKKVERTKQKPSGIKYSLTLHNQKNERVIGFDNAHPIGDKETHDHWHRKIGDKGKPYHYENAAKLLEDFWQQVENYIKKN